MSSTGKEITVNSSPTISRRQAIQLIGTSIAGSLLAASIKLPILSKSSVNPPVADQQPLQSPTIPPTSTSQSRKLEIPIKPTQQVVATAKFIPTEKPYKQVTKQTTATSTATVTSVPTINPDILTAEKITFLASHPFNHGATDKKQIMMTYDEGQVRDNVVYLLDTFKKAGIKCTFFFTGFGLNESGDLLPRIINEEHILGCHSWDHSELTQLSDKKLQLQFSKWFNKLHTILPDYVPAYFRAPYGSINQKVLQAAASYGLQHVGWTVESGGMDEKTKDNVSRNFGLYQNQMKAIGGAIVLSHTHRPYDVSQASEIIKKWKDMGYDLVTVDQGKLDKDRWMV